MQRDNDRGPSLLFTGDTVDQAAQLMQDEDVGSIPVVADQKTKRLIGIITDRDLAVKVVAPARHIPSVTIEEVMSRKPVTCHADDDLQKAVDAMEEHQVRRIPVVDENNQIIGIIAQADIAIRAREQQTTAEVVKKFLSQQPLDNPEAAEQFPCQAVLFGLPYKSRILA